MYKDDYISAFGKLAPNEEWMADTLAKMRAAEAEQEAPGAAGPAGRPALRVSGKKHPRLRRAALPVAAAVALLAVPAAWFWGVAMRPAGSAAPAQYSLQSAGGAADEGQETEQAPRVAAAQDTAGTASSAAAAPETTEDAQAGARKEGRLLFAAEGGGMGMGDITVRTDADLAGANPTYALRTLDDAKGSLMAGEAWIGGTQGGYDGGAVNILHWEITYYRSRLMDTIQPVYCFLIDSPDGEAPFFDDGDPEGYKSVTYAYVPALLPEQLSENTFVQVFN